MISQQSNPSIRLMSAVIWLFAAPCAAADPPPPTPRPGTLGAYARTVTLNRPTSGNVDGRVVLTNACVTELAADGSITLGSVTRADRKKAKSATDKSERSRWQAAYHKQRLVVVALERRRSQLETEIDQIEDLGLTAKTLARLDRAESKLRLIDEEIVQERSALSRIVRDARRRGAEPEWFR